jgi:Secretion system C-terminal sorting domain
MRQFLTLICFFLILCQPLTAQLSSIQWLHAMRTPANPQFGDVFPLSFSVDTNGNSTILGYYTSTVVFDDGDNLVHSGSASNDHLMLIRYDPMGNLLWKSSIIANASNVFEANVRMSIDNMGNVFVAGRLSVNILNFGNNITLSKTCIGNCHEIFIAKYDNNGVAQWVKSIQVTNNKQHQIAGIDCDAQGNIYVAGLNGGTAITFEDSPTITGLIENQQFLAKLEPNGNLIWFRSLEGNSGLATCTILRVSPAGNAYLSGNFDDVALSFGNNVTATPSPLPVNNAYIVKYSTTGIPLWSKSVSGEGVDILDMDIDAQERAHVVCDVTGSLSTEGQTIAATPTSTRPYLGTILRIDSLNTTVALDVDYEEASTYPLFTIAVKPNGNFNVAGVFGEELEVGDITLPDPIKSDILVMAGGDNVPIQAVHLGGGGFENIENFYYGSMIGLDKDGFLYMLGTYYQDAVVGTFSLNSAGMFIAKLNTGPVGTLQPRPKEVSASIMPNPNNGSFTIQLEKILDNGILKLTDIHGKTVLEQVFSGQMQQINHNLPNGCYSLSIQNGLQYQTVKVIVSR